MSPRLTAFLLLACVCGAFAQQLGELTTSDSARMRAAVATVVQHQLQITPTTCAICESKCGACLVQSVSSSTSFKSNVIAPTDITKAFLLSWTGGVVEVADLLLASALSANSSFDVFHTTISSGGAATSTVYMGATAKNSTTGDVMIGLSVGHSSGTTIQQHKSVAYQCCHSCWLIGTCCNTCHKSVDAGDSASQVEDIVNSLTRSALTAMLSATPSTINSRTNPLGLSSYTIAPDVVVHGDWQSTQPESAADKIQNMVKEWPLLKGELESNSTALARKVTGWGFDYVERTFVNGAFRDIPMSSLDVELDLLKAAFAPSAATTNVFEHMKHSIPVAPASMWVMHTILFTQSNGTLDSIMLLSRQQIDTVTIYVTHSSVGFTVAPDFLVYQERSTQAWVFHEYHTVEQEIPTAVTLAELSWLTMWMEGAALQSLAQLVMPDSAIVAGSLATQRTVVDQSAITACTSVWGNAALQQARRINSTNPQLTAAQSLLPTDGSPAPATSFTVPSNDLYKSVITQVNPFHDPQQVLAVNDFGISCQPGDALIVSTQNAASGMAVFNSVMVICYKQRATVWTIGTFASPEQAVSGSSWTSSSVTVLSRGVVTATIQNGTRGFAAKASMAVQELWLVQSVAKDLGVSLPEGLSGRAQGAVEVSAGSIGGWTSALKHFTSGVKSVVSAFKSIASMFGSHTTTTEIKEDTCMAFDNFVANTSVHTIQCMPDTIVREWAGYQFADLKWAFPNNDSYMAELLDWEYAHASNWTKNNIQLSNTKESTLSQLTVFTNHDDEQQCSNWIITEYSGVFKLAPDLIYWRKTKTGFMGFDSSSSVYIQKVPHRISIQDVEAIEEFMEMVMFSKLAANRGLPYTPPKLPTCKS